MDNCWHLKSFTVCLSMGFHLLNLGCVFVPILRKQLLSSEERYSSVPVWYYIYSCSDCPYLLLKYCDCYYFHKTTGFIKVVVTLSLSRESYITKTRLLGCLRHSLSLVSVLGQSDDETHRVLRRFYGNTDSLPKFLWRPFHAWHRDSFLEIYTSFLRTQDHNK